MSSRGNAVAHEVWILGATGRTGRAVAARLAVVVNTIGPFSRTALPIARTCLAGSHYVDVANDVTAVTALLGLNDEATAAGRAFVAAAGFGVLATEAVVAMLCRDWPTPSAVRVDAPGR
jgi:short subunit dehydrogenase-like uncharacterized protein